MTDRLAILTAAYAPSGTGVVASVLALLGAVLVAGWALSRRRHPTFERPASWLLALAAVVAATGTTVGQPAGFRMLAIVGVTLWAMKAVVSVPANAGGASPLPSTRWLAFATLWPGMRPALFGHPLRPDPRGAAELGAKGTVRLLAGAALVAAGSAVHAATGSKVAATLLAAPGLSLVLHFGLFNLASALWRRAGIPAESLFAAPLASRSLGEFWGRRWNLPFTEMTRIAVYRPLAGRTGRRAALLAAFAFSGLLHELAISVPVRAGYGLPSLYFALHGVLVLGERRRRRGRGRVRSAGWRSRVSTLGWLALPLPLLFHPPFLAGVVWPLAGIR